MTAVLAAVTAFAGAAGAGLYNKLEAIPVESVPLTALLRPYCEDLVVGRKSLKTAPTRAADTSAGWARSQGGGSFGQWELIVQGKTDQAVVLTGLEVLELERAPLTVDPVIIETDLATSCFEPVGGYQPVRYLDADLTRTPPRITAEKGSDPVDLDKTSRMAFPYNVSRSVAEVIDLNTSGDTPCLCSWRLGLRWTSGGKSGMLELDRGTDGKIVTAVTGPSDLPFYYRDEEDGMLKQRPDESECEDEDQEC